MEMKEAIDRVVRRENLNEAEMGEVMRLVMTGGATSAQIGGFLIGLRMKGETVDEISSAARVMRELASPVTLSPEYLVDTCGTGGDASGLFNVSTANAFVCAAGGARVAKHGNRSISSKSGSADVLEAAGVRLDLTPEQVAICVEKIGVGFMFAPAHHGAMKHAIGPRKEMGVRTLFNLLGPLTNPAGVPNQVLGVFSADWLEPIAEALARLGSRHVLVVHSQDGMDEISIGAPTEVAEMQNGQVRRYRICPEDFGMTTSDVTPLRVDNAEASLHLIHSALENQPGPARDIVCLNAGAALYAAGVTESLAAGVFRADEIIASGAARHKLDELAALTQSFFS